MVHFQYKLAIDYRYEYLTASNHLVLGFLDFSWKRMTKAGHFPV